MDNKLTKLKDQIKSVKDKGAFHVIAGNFMIKFVTFFGSIVIVRLLSKTEYGLLGYAENLYGFAYILAGLGLSNAALRYIVLAKDQEQKFSCYQYIKYGSFIINVLLAAVFFLFFSFGYSYPQEFKPAHLLLMIMLVMLPFQYQFENNLSTERAFFSNKRYAMLAFISAIGIVTGKCIGAVCNGVIGAVLVVAIVNIILGILSTKNIHIRYFNSIENYRLPRRLKKQINVYSLQYMITNGLWALFMLLDVFLLGKFIVDPAIIADYKVAYVWPGNIGIFCSGIAIFITPYFVKNENNPLWVKKNYLKVLMVNILIVGTIGAIMFFASKPLIYIYAGPQYYNTIPLMRLLIVSAFINNAIRGTTANILAAMGKVKYNMIIAVIGIILDITLNVIFIPRYGMYGVAYTGIIVYSIMAVFVVSVFFKKYNLLS